MDRPVLSRHSAGLDRSRIRLNDAPGSRSDGRILGLMHTARPPDRGQNARSAAEPGSPSVAIATLGTLGCTLGSPNPARSVFGDVVEAGEAEAVDHVGTGSSATLANRHAGGVGDTVHHFEIADHARRIHRRLPTQC